MQIFKKEALDETITNFVFNDFDGINEFNNVEFNNCLFKKFTSNNIIFNNCYFFDSEFESVDLSNSKFYNCSFVRTNIVSSKLVGVSFDSSLFKKVKMIECNNTYNNFGNATFKDVILKNNKMIKIGFNETVFNKTIFDNCNLDSAEIFKTSLQLVDFSTSSINDILIDNYSLNGLTVNEHQALSLSRLLGIIIKE